MYSNLSSKAQFAVLTSVRIVPICFPSLLINKTPPGPVAKIVPEGWTYKQTYAPKLFFDKTEPSKNISGFPTP